MTDNEPVRVQFATWAGFAAMCLGMFMAVLDVQIVATALPAIRSALGIGDDRMSWVQTAYLISEVIAIPLTGFLTRALGVRILFSAGVGVFTVASIGCAASHGFETLIAWRILQGFSGGMLIPLVFSAVFLLFPIHLQGIATMIAGMLAVLAPSVGPVAGGWITETTSWHWLFLVNVTPGIIACALGMTMLAKKNLDRSLLRTLDVLGLALMATCLASLEIGLKEAPTLGWLQGPTPLLLVLSLGAGVTLGARVLTQRSPVLNLHLFRERSFALGCALSFIFGMGLYGSVYLMPVFLSFVRDHGSLTIGLIMLVTGITQMATSPVAVWLEARTSAKVLSMFGFAVFGSGLAMSAFSTTGTDFDGMFWPQVIRGSAIMLCLLPPTRLALGDISPENLPDASALFNLMRNLGGAIGLALIDTVIWGRSPTIAKNLGEDLLAGDSKIATLIGLPPGFVTGPVSEHIDPAVEAIVQPLIQKAALTQAINEAWAMLACAMILAFTLALLVPATRRPTQPQAATA